MPWRLFTASGQLKISTAATTGLDGWIAITAATFAWSSTDGPIFVATTSTDLTAAIGVGDRIKLTQTTTKYFIVVAISTTTITLYGGTDYTLANAAISAVSYSHAKNPVGFNTSPAKWTEELNDTSLRSQASPVAGTWYNLGSLSLSIPIGVWNAHYHVALSCDLASGTETDIRSSLSTVNNGASDADWNSWLDLTVASAISTPQVSVYRSKVITLATKTPHYLIAETILANVNTLRFRGDAAPTIIRAVCAYL